MVGAAPVRTEDPTWRKRPGQTPWRVLRCSVVVHPTCHNANPPVLVEGPVVGLLPVHAKVRREGYFRR